MREGHELGVSIVIPSYNYAHFLRDAIESALNQTYTNIEVIVVDDGSTDETKQVVQRFGSRIRYVFQNNAGLSAARNTGIRESQHPFIVFLDADDILEPCMVEKSVETLLNLPKEFTLIASDESPIDVNGASIRRPRRFQVVNAREVTAEDLTLMNRFSPAVLVRRDVFLKAGQFDTDLKSSEDRDMWIRIAKHGRIHLLTEPLVRKRRHGENMSRNAERQSATIRKVLRKTFNSGALSHRGVRFWLRAIAIYLYQSSLMFHDCGRRMVAARKLCLSLAAWPWFNSPYELDQPYLFRLRALARLVLNRH